MQNFLISAFFRLDCDRELNKQQRPRAACKYMPPSKSNDPQLLSVLRLLRNGKERTDQIKSRIPYIKHCANLFRQKYHISHKSGDWSYYFLTLRRSTVTCHNASGIYRSQTGIQGETPSLKLLRMIYLFAVSIRHSFLWTLSAQAQKEQTSKHFLITW